MALVDIPITLRIRKNSDNERYIFDWKFVDIKQGKKIECKLTISIHIIRQNITNIYDALNNYHELTTDPTVFNKPEIRASFDRLCS